MSRIRLSTNQCRRWLKVILAIIMPDDIAEEKVKALLALGAEVERVRPASIVDKKQVRESPLTAYSPSRKNPPVCSE